SSITTATIVGSTFDSNIALDSGALHNSGELTIIGSTFSSNTTFFGDVGGLTTTDGIVRITQSRFTKNGSDGTHFAGALHVMGGVVLITETTFDHNGADGAGAILVDQNASLVVSESAFVENVSIFSGGGAAIVNNGTVQVTNTTFARNRL